MRLIDEWKQAYKYLSVQIPVIGGALLAAFSALPDELKAAIPHWAVTSAAITFLLGGALGRIIDQTKKPDDGNH